MRQWGIFVMKKELDKIMKVMDKRKIEVFEVRELNYMEKLTYVKDAILFVNEPHVIMFNATEREYKSLCKKLHLTPVF